MMEPTPHKPLEWERGGLIYRPDGSLPWSRTHAQSPRALALGDDLVRIVFSTRDESGRTRPGAIDVSASSPCEVLSIAQKPLLELGSPGEFDDRGVMPACFLRHDGKIYLFYTGWNTSETVPYRLSIGLACSIDGGNSFEKIGPGPIMDRSLHEPLSCSQPYVIRRGKGFRMYYLSIFKWAEVNGRLESYYNLRYVDSDTIDHWQPLGKIAVDCDDDFTQAIAVPTVWREADLYRMVYCFRGDSGFRNDRSSSYRLGYAVSTDGDQWRRHDSDIGLVRSDSGWDAGMQAYPDYFQHPKGDLLFYSGNGFGKEGFGFARRRSAS